MTLIERLLERQRNLPGKTILAALPGLGIGTIVRYHKGAKRGDIAECKDIVLDEVSLSKEQKL